MRIEKGKYYICVSMRVPTTDVSTSSYRTYNEYMLDCFFFHINDIYYSPCIDILFDSNYNRVVITGEDCEYFKEYNFVIEDSVKDFISGIEKNKLIREVVLKPIVHNEYFKFTTFACNVFYEKNIGLSFETGWIYAQEQMKAVQSAYNLFKHEYRKHNSLTSALRGTYIKYNI